MEKLNIHFIKKLVDYLKWLCIINIVYFFFVGMEECNWIKGNKICKTFSSLMNEICIEICIFIVCIVYYGKKIKYKKLKLFLWIIVCSSVGILCKSFIPEEIEMVFNYYVYIVLHLLLISVCIIFKRINEKKTSL